MFLLCSQDKCVGTRGVGALVPRDVRPTEKSKKIPRPSRRVSASFGAGTDGRDEGGVSEDRQRLHRSCQSRRIANRQSGQVATLQNSPRSDCRVLAGCGFFEPHRHPITRPAQFDRADPSRASCCSEGSDTAPPLLRAQHSTMS